MSSLMTKKTQQLSPKQLREQLAVLRGEIPADLKLENVQVLDLVNGRTIDGPILIHQGSIVAVGAECAELSAQRSHNCQGQTAVPGFIDSHLHIESSTMTPFEFERVTLPLGTTSIVCDPHELVNVLGPAGIEWVLRCSEMSEQNIFVQVSSCVPAVPGLDVNAGDFTVDQMSRYHDHPSVLGLAEVMDYPAITGGHDAVLDKLEAFSDLNIDGHAPMLQGLALSAYRCAGIQNCHETISVEEGLEKLSKGMAVMMREGSVAKNLDNLAPLLSESSASLCTLCTDDRNPYEIAEEGHLNYMVKRLIQHHGIPPHLVYRVASWSAAQQFGLRRLGLVAPGYQADLLLIKDLHEVDIQEVIIKGQLVSELNLTDQVSDKMSASQPPLHNTIDRNPLNSEAFDLALEPGDYHLIGIVTNELITLKQRCHFDGEQFDQPGVNYVAVVERYGHELPPALALVQGFELTEGAIATSVGHDSHNIVVIGVDAESMALAVNRLITTGGGLCVVRDGKVQQTLPLPLAGLMSTEPAEQIAEQLKALKKETKAIGIPLAEPFIQMAFLALPVIPELKMTVKGLVDVGCFELIPLKIDTTEEENPQAQSA